MDPDDIGGPHRPLQLGQAHDGWALVSSMPAVLRDLFRMQESGDGGWQERSLRDELLAFRDHVEALTEAEPDAATFAATPRSACKGHRRSQGAVRSLVFGDRADAHLLRGSDARSPDIAQRVRGPQESPEPGANESEHAWEQLAEATT